MDGAGLCGEAAGAELGGGWGRVGQEGGGCGERPPLFLPQWLASPTADFTSGARPPLLPSPVAGFTGGSRGVASNRFSSLP